MMTKLGLNLVIFIKQIASSVSEPEILQSSNCVTLFESCCSLVAFILKQIFGSVILYLTKCLKLFSYLHFCVYLGCCDWRQNMTIGWIVPLNILLAY